MTYEEIMKEIQDGLSGDAETDRKYLREQMEKYKDHELNTEIIRACSRMLTKLVPDEAKEEIIKLLNKETMKFDSAMEEFHYAIYKKDYDKALSIIEALVEKADNETMFQNDSVSEYFTFREFFEEILYVHYNKPEREVRRAEIPFAEIYLNYGSILVELGRIEEARGALEKAMRWNPTNLKIRFEYMETLKRAGMLDEYGEMTKESFKYAYKADDLARCFRDIGWYFVEKQLYPEAMGCYLLSTGYDKECPTAQSELYYIQNSFGTEEPTIEQVKEYSNQYGFPMGPDREIIELALGLAANFEDNGRYQEALYFYSICAGLIQNDDLTKKIEELKGKVELNEGQ